MVGVKSVSLDLFELLFFGFHGWKEGLFGEYIVSVSVKKPYPSVFHLHYTEKLLHVEWSLETCMGT
jgi:hypothetical protein